MDTDYFKKSAFRILQTLYDMSDGDVGKDIVIAHIARNAEIDEQTVYDISKHLEAKGLVNVPIKPNLGVDHSVSITKEGLNEIETQVREKLT